MLPNGFKRVRYKDGDKPVETYEYSPTEQKDILKFLDLIVKLKNICKRKYYADTKY